MTTLQPQPEPASSFAWDEAKSLRALEKQLADLSHLKGKSYGDVLQEEEGWKQITAMIFEHSFAALSQNHTNLTRAKTKGTLRRGASPALLQANFEKRVDAYETCVKTAIQGIRLSLTELDIQGHYDAGNPFAFYLDLKAIVKNAKTQFFLVDAYLDTDVFELYLSDIPATIDVRVLSHNLKEPVKAISRIFAVNHRFELRSSSTYHDRMLFVDNRCWAIGQSLKDAAVKKPTYVVELDAPSQTTIYQPIWKTATCIVKSSI